MQPRIHVSLTLAIDPAYWKSPTSFIAGLPGVLQRRLSGLIADAPNACHITTIDSQCGSDQAEVQDLHLHLAEQRQIAVLWGIDDVLTVRPDLSDMQAWQVLLAAKASHDSRFGINSDVLEVTAETLYGPAPEAVVL